MGHSTKVIPVTQEQEDRIVEVYKSGEKSMSALSKELNLGRQVIGRIARKLGIDKTQHRGNNSGIKIEWTEEMDSYLKDGYASCMVTVADIAEKLGIAECTAGYRAKELGLVKNKKSKWYENNIEFLKQYVKVKSYHEIAKSLNLDPESVRKKMIELGLDYKMDGRGYVPIVLRGDYSNGYREMPIEFIDDISNPKYAAPELAEKWKVSHSTIHIWRRKLFGKFKLQLNTTERMSTAEGVVNKLLDKLDIIAKHQYRIDKYTVDFYLGSKLVVEVNGVYWHSPLKVKNKDKAKYKFLLENGYKLLVIDEYEPESDIECKLKEFWVSLNGNIQLNNLVNAGKSGVSAIVDANGERRSAKSRAKLKLIKVEKV